MAAMFNSEKLTVLVPDALAEMR
jgi:hypothetical protein